MVARDRRTLTGVLGGHGRAEEETPVDERDPLSERPAWRPFLDPLVRCTDWTDRPTDGPAMLPHMVR